MLKPSYCAQAPSSGQHFQSRHMTVINRVGFLGFNRLPHANSLQKGAVCVLADQRLFALQTHIYC